MTTKIDTSWLPKEIQLLHGYDSAIIGITPTDNIAYSFEKCIEITQDTRDMSFENAVDYVEKNLLQTQTFEKIPPVFIKDIF